MSGTSMWLLFPSASLLSFCFLNDGPMQNNCSIQQLLEQIVKPEYAAQQKTSMEVSSDGKCRLIVLFLGYASFVNCPI